MAHSIVKRDNEIQRRVLEELRWDTRVNAAHIGIIVSDGVVALTGTVFSYAEKLAAQEAVHRVAGALDVVNELDVAIAAVPARTDADLARTIRWALDWNVQIPDERVQSTVANGWVTLEGTVDSWTQRVDAENAIRHLAGVRGITNSIRVTGPVAHRDEIRQAIENALDRYAMRESQRVSVEVDGGTVTVSGWVRSWEEKQAILRAAGHAPGVHVLQDHLHIDPY